jgi:predicted Zn-dependent protease
MKRYDEAAQAFDVVLAQDPVDADIWSCAAAVAIRRNDPQKAVALCEQALRLAPHSQTALASLSVGLRTPGR